MQKILLLHGALGSASDFLAIKEELVLLGFEPLCLGFEGHGEKPFLSPLTLDSLRAQTLQFITSQDLSQAPILGYSLGGYVALSLSADNLISVPIITLATKLVWTPELAKREAANCDAEKLQTKVPGYYGQLSKTHLYLPVLLKQTSALLLNMAELMAPDAEKIISPVLLLRGDRDKLVSMIETENYHAALKGGQLGVLPATAHGLSTVNVHLLALLVRNFLRLSGE